MHILCKILEALALCKWRTLSITTPVDEIKYLLTSQTYFSFLFEFFDFCFAVTPKSEKKPLFCDAHQAHTNPSTRQKRVQLTSCGNFRQRPNINEKRVKMNREGATCEGIITLLGIYGAPCLYTETPCWTFLKQKQSCTTCSYAPLRNIKVFSLVSGSVIRL